MRFVAAAAFAILLGCAPARDPLPGFPKVILWAWERPEDLRFIVPSATGVAFLAETVFVDNAAVRYHPRMQPLRVPPETKLIAVVRIESKGQPSGDAADEVLRAIADKRISALQIDFDARESERSFYAGLLREVRARMPREMPLEITALVSWCGGKSWLGGLPVVDVVPMFFRMGADVHAPKEASREPLCRSAVGISTDEVYTEIPRGRRVYVFHPRPWTETDYRAVLQESAKWR
jgi:hypothetical protein